MQISKVTIDGKLGTFGGRALIVQTDGGSFKTPQRVLTSREIQYKAKLPSEPPINNELSEIISQFSNEQWRSFTKKNGSFASRLRTLDSFNDKLGYTVRHFFPQIPSGISIEADEIKLILELQRMSALDFISMPSVSPAANDFDKMAEGFSGEVKDEQREPLVFLDMALEAGIFEKRFKTLLTLSETGILHSIGLVYRPIAQFTANYHLLWKNRESGVLLQMSDIPRSHSETPTMHLLQKWGIDTFSVKAVPYFGPGDGSGGGAVKQKPKKEDLIHGIKRLDQKPLLFRQFGSWPQGNHALGCKCPICMNLTAQEFVEKYWGETENYEGEVFNAANRLHEYFGSSDEFRKGRDYIRKGELAEYFSAKEGLRRSDTAVPKKSTKLNGWLK